MTRLPYRQPHRPQGLSVYIDALRERLTPPALPPVMPLLPLRRGAASPSRLQRRLQHSGKRDRTFFELVRRRQSQLLNQPSWLSQQISAKQTPRPLWHHGLVALVVGLSVGAAAWTALFVGERVTLAGVPYTAVHKFWQDKPARDAYFGGDREALHARLDSLGVEEDVKAFYRDRFAREFGHESISEYELDRYIHQLMFNQTGYVGEAYDVNEVGQLKSRAY